LKGLTLLEILVSITVIGLVMGLVYGAYTSNIEAIELGRQDSRVFQTARVVLDLMRKDLESAFLGAHRADKGYPLGMVCENQEIEGRPADRIDFTALTHLSSGEGDVETDLCEIGYYLVEDKEEGGLILYRRDHGILDKDLAAGGRLDELTTMATELDITFWDDEGTEYPNWNSLEEPHGGELPSLIRVRLNLKDSFGSERTFEALVHPALGGLESIEEG
jgi:type II secretion system protein J